MGFSAGILPQKVLRCRTMRSPYHISKQAHLICPRAYVRRKKRKELRQTTVSAWFDREQRAWRCVRTAAWGEAISRHTSACISVIVVLQLIVPTKLIR